MKKLRGASYKEEGNEKMGLEPNLNAKWVFILADKKEKTYHHLGL